MPIAKNMIFYFIKGLAFSTLISCLLVKFDIVPVRVLSMQMVVLQILLIFGYQKFKPFAFFLIFTLPYTLVAHLHFTNPLFPLSVGWNLHFDDDIYHTGVFIILSLFWGIIVFMLPKVSNAIVLRNFVTFDDKPLFFYFILFLQVLIILFGRTGETIFQTGGYAGGPDAAGSATQNLGGTAIFEYFMVLYPVALHFTGGKKKKIFLLILIGCMYCLKAILFGGRIEMLQCLLLIFILHFDSAKTSLFKLLVLAIPAILFFIFYGFYRMNTNLALFEVLSQIRESFGIAGYTFFANQIDVYYSSSRLYGFCTENILSISERLSAFLYNILAIVVPYSRLPENANLAAYKQSDYYAGGGGFLPIYFFVYLSYFGVILSGIFVGYIFRKIMKHSNKVSIYFVIYVVMILSTYPRWYAYSANVIYKFCLYSVIVLLILRWLFHIFQTKRS